MTIFLFRLLSGLLGLFYSFLAIKVTSDNGISALNYFCTSTWVMLSLFFFLLAVAPETTRIRKFTGTLALQCLGSSSAMSVGVLFYWPDRFANLEHIIAHYLPTILLASIVRKNKIVMRPFQVFIISSIWPILYLLFRNDASKIYGLEFPNKAYVVPVALLIPVLIVCC
ncbi:Hypothetical protein GLP15_5056 [Giardia lamblia P15]|uniref:Uncharacterized protein n=1 Tax=Giardia intestinalis (strain P15) TaxID=658858 RepID=E1EZI8_GIAIA|nr:Hypothetical protein GLP15_5056 [Giardia lamblia P15]